MTRFLSRRVRDLIVWQKAHQSVLSVYRYTKRFPREEIYSLTFTVQEGRSLNSCKYRRGIQETI